MLWRFIYLASQILFTNTVIPYSIVAGFPYCSCFVLLSSFILLIGENNFRSFYSLDVRIPLNIFIYLHEARFCIYPRSWFYTISDLATHILISTFMQYIYCIAFQHMLHLDAYFIQDPELFFSWFIKPSLSLMSAPASSTFRTKSILSSIWSSTFLADFLSFSMVWLI